MKSLPFCLNNGGLVPSFHVLGLKQAIWPSAAVCHYPQRVAEKLYFYSSPGLAQAPASPVTSVTVERGFSVRYFCQEIKCSKITCIDSTDWLKTINYP
jgi:hypothetical protein